MDKKKCMHLFFIILVIILCISVFAIFKETDLDKAVIKKFLKQYYTVEEIQPEKFITEASLNNEMSEYTDFMDEKCLEKFVMSRAIFANKLNSQQEQFTLAVKKIDIQNTGKTDDNLNKYDYNIILLVTYQDKTYREATAKGSIRIMRINRKPIITYYDYTNLEFN